MIVLFPPARPVGKRAPWPARAFLTERLHASETRFDFLITGVLVYGQDGATITTDVLDLHFFLLPRQRSGMLVSGVL
jgi:hypothetical protein